MKQQKPDNTRLPEGGNPNVPSLAELRAVRHAQKATSARVEDLKLRLFRITEQHMDQAIRLMKRWMIQDKDK